jgi:SAM-dependent methyltransferase
VTYVDRVPNDVLRRHYPELDENEFVPVSVLSQAEDLASFADASLDFIVAIHLLEHVEDPIAAFREFERVLRHGGTLYLALPDKRKTFDRRRTVTPPDHIFDEHDRALTTQHRRSHYLEWSRLVEGNEGPEAEQRADELPDMSYSIHFHVWTPDAFVEFFVEARRRYDLGFQLLHFMSPESEGDNEFLLLLARGSADELRLPPSDASSSAGESRLRREQLAQCAAGALRRLRHLAARVPVSAI